MNYKISNLAINDLKEIAQYTSKTWGVDAVDKYVPKLMAKLDAIGSGRVVKEKYIGRFRDFYVTRFRYHLIYYRVKVNEIPEIARILHQKQDKVSHLEDSLLELNRIRD